MTWWNSKSSELPTSPVNTQIFMTCVDLCKNLQPSPFFWTARVRREPAQKRDLPCQSPRQRDRDVHPRVDGAHGHGCRDSEYAHQHPKDFGSLIRRTRQKCDLPCQSPQGTEADIRALTEHTDTVAEIQNTLRTGTFVTLSGVDIVAA